MVQAPSHWRSTIATLGTGSLVAALPKCPACLAAYLGFASGLGLDLAFADAALPVAWSAFAVALIALAYRSYRKQAWGPIGVAALGACALAFAPLSPEPFPLSVTGFVLLGLGTTWSAHLPRRARDDRSCR